MASLLSMLETRAGYLDALLFLANVAMLITK
jgi:hypothetical protein